MTSYEDRVAAQIEQHRAGINAHALPDIFHGPQDANRMAKQAGLCDTVRL